MAEKIVAALQSDIALALVALAMFALLLGSVR